MTSKTVQGIVKHAHALIETATDDLDMALQLANQLDSHPVLRAALHDATIRATQLAAQLEPILSTLAMPAQPGPV